MIKHKTSIFNDNVNYGDDESQKMNLLKCFIKMTPHKVDIKKR